MKRFLLFAYSDYYPQGGMNDFEESFDTLEDAKAYYISDKVSCHSEECHVYDLELNEIVYTNID
jgi:hypothetical protein